MLLTTQHPVLIGLAYMGAGMVVKLLAAQWDLTAGSMQRIIVGGTEGCLLIFLLMLDAPIRGGLIWLSGLRLLLTVLCLPLVRAIVVGVLPQAQATESSSVIT